MLFSICTYSQIEFNETQSSASVVNTQFKGSFLPIGLILEQKVGKNQTLFIQAKMVNHVTPTFRTTGNNNGLRHWQYAMAGQIRLEYKNYFNLAARAANGRSIYNNSGMYLGVLASGKTPALIMNQSRIPWFYQPKLSLGPVFGVQRTFDNNISIDYAIGIGVIARTDFVLPGIVGHLIFSYVFLPKKNKRRIESDTIFFDE